MPACEQAHTYPEASQWLPMGFPSSRPYLVSINILQHFAPCLFISNLLYFVTAAPFPDRRGDDFLDVYNRPLGKELNEVVVTAYRMSF